MAEIRVQRRLAAILAADVVGYSQLMEHDETGTSATVKARWGKIVRPLIAEHHGRLVKLMGDGVLIEFGGAGDAVQCAIELQERMVQANRGLPETRSILLQAGINLGDVIVEGDLYGDGVNVAAGRESLAEPGGIRRSGSVYDQVKRKLQADFAALGPRMLKNIAEPVHVYQIRLENSAEPEAACLLREPLVLPAKPSIAVLPFTNMGQDPEHGTFVDGLTEDLITDLSRHPELFVIAGHSTFAYKGKAADVRQIARDRRLPNERGQLLLRCFPDCERRLWFANLSLRSILAAISSQDQQETLMTEPLIDLSNPESWRRLKQARKCGYLTRDEFDQMFGPELPPDRIEALKRELWKLHITILVTGGKRSTQMRGNEGLCSL